ncbi:MAG: M56 family metallopeptidase [Chitinophagaceae bacterium]
MHFDFIQKMFSGDAATAICWTLIHSLWQGLFFAIVTGLIMLGTKRSTPSLRYKLLSVQFLLFIPVVITTFVWQWSSIHSSSVIYNDTEKTALIVQAPGGSSLLIQHSLQSQVLNIVSSFLSGHSSTITAIWFVIFLIKSIKIISSLAYTQHLRVYKVHQPSIQWQNRLNELRIRLHIKKTMQLLESEIINVPAVFGHLKPVIFVPLGMLSGLSAEQVEAVLFHELAHIRRSDYLFNLLQNIIETIFFFNPAILWMSSLLREERENCCDDIAIAHTKNKKQFVESLIQFREMYVYNRSKYVTAFPGTKNSFVNRITRIAMNKNKSLNPAENVFLAISLAIISTLIMAFSQAQESPAQKAVPVTNAVKSSVSAPVVEAVVTATSVSVRSVAAVDTVPATKKTSQQTDAIRSIDNGSYSVIYSDIDKSAGKETVVLKTDDNEYKIVKVNGVLAYLMVNDEKIPQERMGEYSDLLKKINEQLERMRKEQEIRDKEQEKRNAEQEVRNKEQKKRDDEQAIRNQEQEKRNAEQAVRDKEQEKRNEEQIARNKEQEKRDAEQTIRNQEQEKRNAEQAIRNKEQEQRDAEQLIRNKEQEQRNAEQAIRNKEQEQRNAEQEIRNKEQEVRNAETKKLIDDLISDKIIQNRYELTFKLTDDEFVVNGVKQSAEVFKKYKTKYSKLVGGTFTYRNY